VFALDIEIFFKGVPGWFLTVLLYLAFSAVQQKRAARA
jgi:hypothetical protein